MTVATPIRAGAFRRRQFGRNHAYYLGNEKLDSVTTIIKNGVPSPGLIGWAAKVVAEYAADHLSDLVALGAENRNAIVGLLKEAPNDQRDTAGIRGKQVHELAQQLHKGLEIDIPENLIGHVDAYLQWLADWTPEDLFVERPCYNVSRRYAGAFDYICRIAGETWLIEWKTNRTGPFPDVALQLAGYRFAERMLDGDDNDIVMPKIDRCGVVWITADSYQFYPVTADEDVWRTFLYAKEVSQFAKTRKTLLGAALEPGLPGIPL